MATYCCSHQEGHISSWNTQIRASIKGRLVSLLQNPPRLWTELVGGWSQQPSSLSAAAVDCDSAITRGKATTRVMITTVNYFFVFWLQFEGALKTCILTPHHLNHHSNKCKKWSCPGCGPIECRQQHGPNLKLQKIGCLTDA